MPTIKQLPTATSVSASDLIPASQNGSTRGLSVGNLLSSTQAAISLVPGRLLGRVSATAGGPEPVTLGGGLAVTGGVLDATANDHTRLPVSSGLGMGDEVVVNAGGAAKRMAATALRSLFSAGSGVTIDASGTISAPGGGTAMAATATTLGGVKPGTGLAVSGDGTLTTDQAFLQATLFTGNLPPGDLRRFGWVADGRDQTAVMQAAIDALPAEGGEVFVPYSSTGTTLGTVNVNKSVVIRGEGGPAGQATLRPAARTTTMFSVTGPFVTLTDLAIGPANPGYVKQTAGSYVRVEASAARFRAERLTLTEFHEGITIAGDVPTVEMLELRGFLYSTGLSQSSAFVHLLGGLDVRIDGVTCNGPGTGQADAKSGIWIENVGDIIVTNADIIAMGTDLLVAPGSGQTVTSLWLIDSFLDTAYRGAEFSATGGGAIARSRLTNVWASSHQTDGILINGPLDGLDIDSPHVFLNAGHGINVQGGTNIRIHGGQVAQNAGHGISVAAGVSTWSISGAVIGATGGLSGNAGWGVLVAAGAGDTYRIEGNTIVGNGAGAVSDGGTGANKSVWSNLGDGLGYAAYRDGSGMLRFAARQAGAGGFVFANGSGTELLRVGSDGALTVAGTVTTGAGPLTPLQPATTARLGGVKPDGSTVTVAADGTISAAGSGAGRLVVGHTYVASGAIAPTDGLAVVNSGSDVAMTLASGTADGQRLFIKRYGSGAMTVTLSLDGAAGAVITANSQSYAEAVSLAWSAGLNTWLAV